MNEPTIPQLSDEVKRDIQRTVAYHYGFTPSDEILLRIDGALRNHYAALHRGNIIREVVVMEIGNDLLKHRDRIGSLEFERLWAEKSIFRYSMFASMCYRAGIPAGAISLCRTAIEAGLRERLAEVIAKKEAANQKALPAKTLEHLGRLRDESLSDLIRAASEAGILNEHDIEESFNTLKFQGQGSRKVLDKFIHGDIVWMVAFVRSRKADTMVIGAKDELHEAKIVADMELDRVAVEVLRATDRIAAILYLK